MAPPFIPHHAQQQAFHPRPPQPKRLPDPVELANRLEEARTSAKLLEQVVACTPPSEVLSNELITEFADRCTGASRSIQAYMAAENPAPDNDTMESLIDTNEQLQTALNHHRRAVLQAKKQLGSGDSSRSSADDSPAPPPHHRPRHSQQPSPPLLSTQSRPVPPPPVASRKPIASGSGSGKGKANLDAYEHPTIAGPSRSANATPHRDTDDDEQDPFRDPAPDKLRLSFEPFHPGFGSSSGGAGSSSAAAGAATSSSGGADGGRRREEEPVTPLSDSEDDGYRATPLSKMRGDGDGEVGGVYRY
jgi:hypothetical protein